MPRISLDRLTALLFPRLDTRGLAPVACGLAVFLSMLAPVRASAAERKVLAVAACDSYGDLKKQLTWLGTQIDTPGLAGLVEGALLVATQGKGLAGLDVQRPLGVVVTTDGTDVAVHGYVPVKNLDTLLASLQSVTGPVERSGNTRGITLPNGIPLEIIEDNGWAIIGIPGTGKGVDDPAAITKPLTQDFSVGIQAFPSRLPESLRKQLEAALNQAAKGAAAQGQPIDPDTFTAALEHLHDTESHVLGLTIDGVQNRVFLEDRSVMVDGSEAATTMAGLGNATLTVASPASADGKPAAIRGYVAQKIPVAWRPRILTAIDKALPTDDDSLTKMLVNLLREVFSAMLSAGAIEVAMTVDTSAANKEKPVPPFTTGLRVKDGMALEQRVKQLLEKKSSLPAEVGVTFNSGKVGAANLHTIAIDLTGDAAEQLGPSLDITLAVTPEYVFVLAGGEPKQRLEEMLKTNGVVDPDSKPVAALQVAMDRMLAYAVQQGMADEQGGESLLAAAAQRAVSTDDGGTGRALVQLLVRPIERGVTTQILADAGVLRMAAALWGGRGGKAQAGPGAPAIPLPPGFPVPVPR